MSTVGEKRRCAICNKLVKIIALISDKDSWFTQQLECGHTGRIRIINNISDFRDIT